MMLSIHGAFAAQGGFSLERLIMPGPLSTAHEEYETSCEKCHDSASKENQTSLCLDCHEAIASDLQRQEGFHGRLTTNKTETCKSCHTEHQGRNADIVQFNKLLFDHRLTDFPLQGGHSKLTCESCHEPDKTYAKAPSRCAECHKDDDIHAGAMGEQCTDCHVTDGWKKQQFDHGETGFTLAGAHQETACAACHPDNRLKGISKQCVSCHASDDIHGGNRGRECSSCHDENSWENSIFDHDHSTDFKLTGAHTEASCEDCHRSPSDFDHPSRTTCYACHKAQDAHFGANGKTCADCHDTKDWGKSTFDHTRDTDFPLSGAHQSLSCDSCHRPESEARSINPECQSCHAIDNIHGLAFGNDCKTCHSAEGWFEQIRFNHELTRFPLLGIHALTSCEACHNQDARTPSGSQCEECHEKAEPHNGYFGRDCKSCHNPNDWQRWIFDHNSHSQFQLSGKHLEAACGDCHDRPLTELSARNDECYSCHKGDDIHRNRFGKQCDRCHSTDAFHELRIREK